MKEKLPIIRRDLIGQDTEFFLWDTRTQEVVPSYRYFPKKEDSKPICIDPYLHPGIPRLDTEAIRYLYPKKKYLKLGYRFSRCSGGPTRIYRDGLAVEVNSDAVDCRAWIWQDIKRTMLASEPARKPKWLTWTARPYVEITEKLISEFPPDLRVLGCSPTLDAYTEKRREILVDPLKTLFRTCGAHLHMSFKKPYVGRVGLPEEAWAPIIKLSDLLLGTLHAYIFGDDLEWKRRKLYGSAGEFRFQDSYGGIEYRVLSSRIYNHPGIASLFLGLWKHLIGDHYWSLWTMWDKAWEDDLQLAINTGEGLEKFIPIWTRFINHAGTTFTIGRLVTDEPSTLRFWQTLRRLNQAGKFPDAGIATRPSFEEAHKGFGEYRLRWGI